jgi:DNA-directed RNA polymerase subunit omega
MSNMLPAPDILNNSEDGRFVLANLAAKRAKQLKDGAPPLVSVESNHPLTVALAEIAAGKIKAIVQPLAVALEPEESVFDKVTDEPLPAELGMLLPALEESEVMVETEVHLEDEHEPEVAAAAPAESMTISDLVGEEEPEAVETTTPEPGEEETLSLNEIAEEETLEEEEQPEA